MPASVAKTLPFAYPVHCSPAPPGRWRAMLGAFALGALWSLGVAGEVAAQPATVPQSVRLFEQQKHVLPKSNFNLSLCKLLARGPRNKVFPGLPADVGPETCDLSNVYLAWNGFCDAGVRDKKGGVHFSQSLGPMITIIEYSDGIVIWVNNYLKFDVITTAEDEQAAIEYFSRIHAPDAVHDVRGATLQIFPADWDGEIPLKKRIP